MKRLLYILFAAMLLASCAKDDDGGIPHQRPDTATQTMLLYMPGQSLRSYYQTNIDGIKQAVNARVPGEGRILVCYQPRGNGMAELSEIRYDYKKKKCVVETLKTYSPFSAKDPQSVQQMLADVATEAPAHQYGLIIGCHGKAWLPVGKGLTGFGAPRPDGTLGPDEADTQMGPFGPLAPGAKRTRSFGDSGYELNIEELAAAIEAQSYRLNYLVFDACFMANIETLYDLRNAAQRIIASPCEIMAAGFPYKRTIPYLFAENGASPDLQRVCEEFWKFYMYDWNSVPYNDQSGCISLAVTSELEPLAQAMGRINASVSTTPELSDLQTYEPFSSHLFYDLGDYVRTACQDPALLDDFALRFAKAFPEACRLHTPAYYSAYNGRLNPITYYSGVTLSQPAQRYTAENQQTAWYRATH